MSRFGESDGAAADALLPSPCFLHRDSGRTCFVRPGGTSFVVGTLMRDLVCSVYGAPGKPLSNTSVGARDGKFAWRGKQSS